MTRNDDKIDILIVEDNIETLNFLRIYFKSYGYSCKEARTGRKGLEIMKESKPSVVFLDIILPDMSGYEVLKSMKSKPYGADVPIIFLTALPKSEVKKRADELDAFGVISKPFNLEDLEIIEKFLKKQKEI